MSTNVGDSQQSGGRRKGRSSHAWKKEGLSIPNHSTWGSNRGKTTGSIAEQGTYWQQQADDERMRNELEAAAQRNISKTKTFKGTVNHVVTATRVTNAFRRTTANHQPNMNTNSLPRNSVRPSTNTFAYLSPNSVVPVRPSANSSTRKSVRFSSNTSANSSPRTSVRSSANKSTNSSTKNSVRPSANKPVTARVTFSNVRVVPTRRQSV